MDLIEQKQRFDSAEFEAEFHCDAPLGAFPAAEQTIFRLWSPTAEGVELALYAEGSGGAALKTVPMVKGERGLWSFETPGDLNGIYYDFKVTVDGEARRTADPYARACGVNGARSMVIDLKTTDPEGWAEDSAPAPTPEQFIWEVHVKDFSFDPEGGFAEADRGKYTALCRTGTTLNSDKLHPTGVDYLKRLGVTHVQLMPVYDYCSVDEGGDAEQFNWGYDPANYNVPEGSYSSDPHHGEVRIRELKQAIQSLHANGFRVVMDVVYNHTYRQDSWLWRAAPWYYYRQNADGSYSNGSGCGNDLATERSMCAKYIKDSVLYWAREYHMDGFRFDLMGLLDVKLLNDIQTALDEEFGVGEKLLYGEPWRAGDTAAPDHIRLCTKDNLRALNPRIGAFCDNTRDAVKGSLMHESSRGFVNGGGMSAVALRRCLTGWAEGEDAPYQAPSQTVTYLSCHDDWTLWDKLVSSMDVQKNYDAILLEVERANRLAAAINLCCQGRVFLHAGEEFGRTKGGVKNSYKTSPWINCLDWRRAWKARELVDYYRGLIALRKLLPGLQDKSERAFEKITGVEKIAEDCVIAAVDNAAPGSRWAQVLLCVNASRESHRIPLPAGTWQVLADANSSFRFEEDMTVADITVVPPVSALILGKKV